MNISIDEFEQIIDETILKRGLLYFEKGYITEFEKISDKEFEASVSGTEEYTVQLRIKNNIITEHNCDCPYDMGPVCKHIVAVIFYMQQDLLAFDKSISKKSRKKKTKSATQQIKELLKAISHEELIEFVKGNSKKDRKFRNYFLASFGHLSENQSKEFYLKQIKSILKVAAGRDGWIGWSDMRYVAETTESFLTNAEKYFENGNYQNVINISTALLEEMTEALQYADDSSGELGYFIDYSVEMLSKVASEELPKDIRDKLFEYCISTFKKRLFYGWGWHLGIINVACSLIKNKSEADEILKCLNSVKGEYEREEAQVLKLYLIRKYKSEREVHKFIEKHISNSSIRQEEISLALENNNFERAIKLSKDGIKYNEKNKPGLVKDWYNCLLKIAQTQKDTPKIIEYARFLFIDDFRAEQNYYKVLKSNIEDDKWHPFVEEIIKDIASNRRRGSINTELIRKIYIKEKWWDKLLNLLRQNTSLQNIEENEKHLSRDYTPELVQFYSEGITNYIKVNIGRNHYKEACRYLRRMKKLGAGKQVNVLIENFKKEYPQRRALMDELSRV